MSRCLRRFFQGALVVAPVIVLLLSIARPAVADVTDEIYSDAKDVITQLIEEEVAQSIGANLGCYSPNGLLKYYPESLQAVYERNFGALKDSLRRETTTLVGNYVFRSFQERRSIPLGEFLPIKPFNPDDKDAKKCADDVRAIGGPERYQATLAADARRQNGRYLPLDVCSGTADGQPEEFAVCQMAKAVLAAANGAPDQAQDAFGQAVAAVTKQIFLDRLPPGALSAAAVRSISEEVRATLVTGTFPPKGFLAEFADPEMATARALVADALQKAPTSTENAELLRSFLANGSEQLKTDAIALFLLVRPDAEPPVSIVKSQNAEAAAVSKPMGILGALSASKLVVNPGEGLGATITRALLAHESVVPTGTVAVTEEGSGVRITVAPATGQAAAFTGSGLTRLETLYEAAQERTNLQGWLSDGLAGDPTIIAAVNGIIGLIEVIEEFAVTVKSAGKTATGGFDLLTLLRSLENGKLENMLCPPSPAGKPDTTSSAGPPVMVVNACTIYSQVEGLLDPRGELHPILSAVVERNYRALAVNAVSAVFSDENVEEICCGQKDSCSTNVRVYGRLAKSLVSYILLPRDDEDASLAARAAFKSAAVDAIRSIRGGGSIQNARFVRSWVPTAALRASWSNTYRMPDHGGIRYIATVDWPAFRGRIAQDSTIYFGWQINLIDFLAPLAELASRDTTVTHGNDAWIFAAFVQPRVSALFALPGLSDHVGLTLGFSLRGAGAFRTLARKANGDPITDPIGNPTYIYPYSTVFGTSLVRRDHDAFDRVLGLTEVSAGVEYVP